MPCGLSCHLRCYISTAKTDASSHQGYHRQINQLQEESTVVLGTVDMIIYPEEGKESACSSDTVTGISVFAGA